MTAEHALTITAPLGDDVPEAVWDVIRRCANGGMRTAHLNLDTGITANVLNRLIALGFSPIYGYNAGSIHLVGVSW